MIIFVSLETNRTFERIHKMYLRFPNCLRYSLNRYSNNDLLGRGQFHLTQWVEVVLSYLRNIVQYHCTYAHKIFYKLLCPGQNF